MLKTSSKRRDDKQQTRASSKTETQKNNGRLNPHEIIGLAAVLTLGVLVRAAYLVQYKSNVPYYAIPIVDSSYYDGWARTVIEGQGYGHTPFYLAPLYPYFLAFLYLISGASLTFVYIVQSILGLVITGLVYVLGRWTFDHKRGLVAAALIQFYAPLLYLEPKLLTEPLAITLNLVSLVVVWRAVNYPSWWRFIAAGIMLGLSAVCRPVGLIMIFLVVVWLVILSLKFRSRNGFSMSAITLSHPALVVLGACLAILPVSVRNATIGRDFTLISTNGGIVFAQGNNQTATGISMPLQDFSGVIVTQQQEEMAIASEALGRTVTPSESSHYWYSVGMRFIRDNPGRFLRLLGRKFVWSVHNAEPGCSYNVYAEKALVPVLRILGLPFVLLASLALYGVIVGYRSGNRHAMALVGLYIASIYLGLLITSVSSRYRVPAIPGLAIFAGFGLIQLLESLSSRYLRSVLLFVGCLLPFIVVSLVPLPVRLIPGEAWANIASCYASSGDIKQSVKFARKALRTDPGLDYVHQSLGVAYMKSGKLDEAEAEFASYIKIQPNAADGHFYLAAVLDRKGKIAEAILHYVKAAFFRPQDAEIHYALGNILDRRGWIEEAVLEYREASNLSPRYRVLLKQLDRLNKRRRGSDVELNEIRNTPKVASALANIHYARGHALLAQEATNKAVIEYRRAIALKPDFVEALVELGLALMSQNKWDEAVKVYNKAISIKPDLPYVHANLAVALYYTGDCSGAWREVHLCRRYGGDVPEGFIAVLSQRMPEPIDDRK